jgi:hypothetical protein
MTPVADLDHTAVVTGLLLGSVTACWVSSLQKETSSNCCKSICVKYAPHNIGYKQTAVQNTAESSHYHFSPPDHKREVGPSLHDATATQVHPGGRTSPGEPPSSLCETHRSADTRAAAATKRQAQCHGCHKHNSCRMLYMTSATCPCISPV